VLAAFASGNAEVRALLEDRANSDANVRRVYAGRFVFELLQNACDAHDRQLELHAQGRAEAPSTPRALVQLTDTHLLVANTGYPFSFQPLGDTPESSGIHSVCRYGATTKGSLRFKGQFGIGFKSVDEVSDEVFILSGGFRLRFSRERLRLALGAHAPTRLPLLYAPEWFEDDEAPAGSLVLAHEYDTVVALRLGSADHHEIRARLAEIGPTEILLLETLRELVFVDGDTRRFTLEPSGAAPERWEVRLHCGLQPPEVHEFLLFRSPIGEGPQDHRIAWPLDAEGALAPLPAPQRHFHAFYPVSRERSGAPFLVHSYFKLDPSRKSFADGVTERADNEALFSGLLDLLEASLPTLVAQPRGERVLHALVWPDCEASSAQGQAFVNALRARAWGWPIFEGFDRVPRMQSHYGWPPPEAGLDNALAGIELTGAPFPRRSDAVHPRPEASQPSALDLASWLRHHPPRIPSPEHFGRLLAALFKLISTDQRLAFQKAVRGAPVLPVRTATGFRFLGLSEGISVFRADEQSVPIPAALEGLLRTHVLAPGVLGEDPTGLAVAAEVLFEVRPLSPAELIESLMDGVDARGQLDQEEALGALEFVVSVLGSELQELERTPHPWCWSPNWWNPTAPWATRRRLARLPIPLADGTALPAEQLIVEDEPGELSVLYPEDSGQVFLNEQSEHPRARELLGRFEGWTTRRRVYAYIGAWPMPRLHAVDLPEGAQAALDCPHPGVAAEDWHAYLHAESERQSFGNVTIRRSIAWPDLSIIVRHCTGSRRLGSLLEVVRRHASEYLPDRGSWQAPLWLTRNKYFCSFLDWQLRTTPWLPTTRQGEEAVPTRPDHAWWTEHRLDARRLHEARWNHLPFAHAGNCERSLAVALRLPIYEEPSTPDRDVSECRTVQALLHLHTRAREHDDPGLRRLYRELMERLADLSPRSIQNLDEVLTVSGSGAAALTPISEAYIDDLQTPLPLGTEVLPLAIFATGQRQIQRLAGALGLRLLSQQRIEYHAEGRELEFPAEHTLTTWLQWLRPYVFALRAHSHLVPVAQRIDLTVSAELMNRFTLAVVEVVDGVELHIDGHIVARQGSGEPVVLAHEPDSRQTIPLFLRRALADRHGQEAERLLPFLARPAAELAGDPSLAHTLELLLLTIGSPDDVRAEAFLRDRCGVSAHQLNGVRDACGVISAAREIAAEEARTAERRTRWQALGAVLARPLLALLLVAGRSMRLRELRSFLDAHRDAAEPLESAKVAFEALGIPRDHTVWDLQTLDEAETWLVARPELLQAISRTLSAEEVAAERLRVAEAELQRARLHMLALARVRAPDARIHELIAAWDELAGHTEPGKVGALAEVIRGFIAQLQLGEHLEQQALGPPGGRLWSGAHLDLLGISAADIAEVSIELQRYLDGAQGVQTRRENAYAAWVRRQRLHQTVKREVVRLRRPVSPASSPCVRPQEPAQVLTLDSRGGACRYTQKNRRNSLTGGLGEVFVLMQELEIWRTLAPESRSRLLDEVALEYADIRAATAIDAVRHGDPASEVWEETLASLLRVGDYIGARCDLLGVGSDEQIWYMEVKASSRGRLDRFFLSAPEWEFLSRQGVRDRCAIVCVSGAAPGRTPRVELLERPAFLVAERQLDLAASTHEVVLHRMG